MSASENPTAETEKPDASQPAAPSRARARRRALDILFEAELREMPPMDIVQIHRDNTQQIINPYTVELIQGVNEHRAEIDEYLGTYAQGWTLERMPPVDRNILRIGVWELLFNEEISDDRVLAEAVKLSRELSTHDSPPFINGLLGRIEKLKPTLLA